MIGEVSILKGAAKESPRGALMLRRHKMLPHPIKQLDLKLNTYQLHSDHAEVRSSEDLSSRMLHYSQKETGAPELPLTPPTNTRSPSENELLISSHFNFDQNSTSRTKKPPSLNTLRSGQSPPTPDFTPPRQSRSTFVSLTQNPYPSSNSFLTAPEDPYISDEDESGYAMMTLLLSTRSSGSHLRLSDAEQLQDAYEQNIEEYSEEGGIRPKIWFTESQPKATEIVDPQSPEVGRNNENSALKDYSSGRGSTVRQCKSCQSQPVHYFANEATETTTGAKFYLSFQPSDPIIPHYQEEAFSHQLNVEQEHDEADEAEESRDSILTSSDFSMHSNRSPIRSTHGPCASWTSAHNRLETNVKTLRHTKKRIGLRDGIELPNPLPLAISNNDFYDPEKLYRSHPTFKATELVNPIPALNNTIPKLSSEYRKEIIKKGGIPVLVIPERTSCGKTHRTLSLRSTSSRKTRRSISPNIIPLSCHKTLHDRERYDLNLWKSDLLSSFPDPGYNESSNRPTSSTSIRDSAFTSQSSICTSRPSSLTTESLRTHNQLLAMNSSPKPDMDFYPPLSTTSSKISSENSEQVGINFHHHSSQNHMLSDYVTPYSQSSYETAAEVSEALAVSLFPHQTKSIMVRQNRTSLGSFAHPTTFRPEFMTNSKSLDTGQRRMHPTALETPYYSESDVDSETKTESLTSNLKNSSEPPVIVFHPPTPRTADQDPLPTYECLESESDLLHRQISISSFPASSYDFEDFSLLTKTVSNAARPAYLDRISSHILNEDDTSSGIFSISDIVPDQSKLHPFWRPTKFWNDDEDLNENFDHKKLPSHRRKIFSRGTLRSRLIKSIRVFPLQKSREPSTKSTEYQQVTRISENQSVMKNYRIRCSRGDTRSDTEDKYWGINFKEGNGGRMHSFPGLGLRIENKGWNELKKWAKEKKKDKKLENQISTSSPQPSKKLDDSNQLN
ncbi:hypothetical protein OnM2_019025 [Erysiphe neolycopersici]|uniref:Uncharacterized protein n=1 Tax=Erysiphe neolycopersici TaxID=212602 RepID=A0A420I3N2_9PEZI|nr:hypothetical protein OnM2_019025 [Erysiphe neolycopersici]